MNKVEISGGLVNKTDWGFTESGRAYARFTLAVPGVRWNPQESREEVTTTYVSCVAWGGTAEELMEYDPRKGEKMWVVGKLSQNEWVDKKGEKQSKTRVSVDFFHWLNPKSITTAEDPL